MTRFPADHRGAVLRLLAHINATANDLARTAPAALAIIDDHDSPLQSPATNPGSRPTTTPDPTASAAMRRRPPSDAVAILRQLQAAAAALDDVVAVAARVSSPDAKHGQCWVCLTDRRSQVLTETGECGACVKAWSRAIRRSAIAIDRETWRRDRRRAAETRRGDIAGGMRRAS